MKILSVQGIKSRIQDIMASEDRWDGARRPGRAVKTRPRPRFRGPLGARACALGHVLLTWLPFLLVPINTPLGSSVWQDPEFRASCCNFVFRFVVVVVVVLLVVVLAIRAKERECVSVVLEG